jgi:hypothetical protein
MLTAFLFSSVAHADSFVNGGFETGDSTGWLTIGDAMVTAAFAGTNPIAGSYQALISNAPSPFVPPDIAGTYSGHPSVGVTCYTGPCPNADPLEDFLGLTRGSLYKLGKSLFSPGGEPYEGSAISQSFTGNAGDVLSFNFDYLTNEGSSTTDYAFLVVDGTVSLLANYSPSCAGPNTGFMHDCGYQSFATTLTSSGSHYVAVGVIDSSQDPGVNSAVLVDRFAVSSVPEPSTLALLTVGSGFAGWSILRQRRSAKRRSFEK